jgi:hypothetical protein
MIDPLEAVIALLRADGSLTELVGDRIAAKHRYGDASKQIAGQGAPGWSTDDAGLALRLDGGSPELYAPLQDVRIEARIYAGSQIEGMQVWMRLVEISRDVDRALVDTTGGRALVHEFLQDSGPSLLFDSDLSMDLVLAFFGASVGEEAVDG